MPRKRRFLVIAHRGASGTYPENTFAAFQGAIRLGADMIETDIRLTKDRHPVVFHDATLGRTTKEKGPLKEKVLKELDQKIPTLSALLRFASNKIGLLLELKPDPGNEKELVERVLQILKKYPSRRKRILLGSSDPMILGLLAQKTGQDRMTPIFKKKAQKWLLWAKKEGLSILCPAKKVCTKAFVQEAHAKGLKVYVWVANKRREIRRFCEMGVDGIMSDYPERCLASISR